MSSSSFAGRKFLRFLKILCDNTKKDGQQKSENLDDLSDTAIRNGEVTVNKYKNSPNIE